MAVGHRPARLIVTTVGFIVAGLRAPLPRKRSALDRISRSGGHVNFDGRFCEVIGGAKMPAGHRSQRVASATLHVASHYPHLAGGA